MNFNVGMLPAGFTMYPTNFQRENVIQNEITSNAIDALIKILAEQFPERNIHSSNVYFDAIESRVFVKSSQETDPNSYMGTAAKSGYIVALKYDNQIYQCYTLDGVKFFKIEVKPNTF